MSLPLTDLQVSILRVLWDLGEASVVSVHRETMRDRDVAESTVAKLLSRMERRGLVTHRRQGRVYLYRPLVSEAEVRDSVSHEFATLASRLSPGGVSSLLAALLGTARVTPGDLEQAAELIRAKAAELEGND